MSKMKVLVFGDKAKCSQCRTYAKIEATVAGLLGDAGIAYEFLDYTANPKGYAAGKKAVGKASIPKYPELFALNGKQVATNFVVRGMTAAAIAKKVIAACGDCGEPADEPVLYKECPTCKGAGKIAVALACLLTLWGAGCCATRIDTPEASGWRVAFLYPFEMGQAKLQTKNGSAEIGTYKTDGGSAGVCQVIDSSGNVVGAFIGGAAKAAVVP